MSRPTKLTPKRREQIAALLAEGESIDNAAIQSGISPRTYHYWIERGMAEQQRLDDDLKAKPLKTEAAYLQFLQETARALAIFEAELVGDIKRVARGYEIQEVGKDGETYYRTAIDWRAGAWLLERKFPDRYGQRQKHELSGPNGGPIQQAGPDLSKLSTEELAVLHRLRLKAEGSSDDSEA